MNIANLDKAAVLAALYNRAQTQGIAALQYRMETMPLAEARTILGRQTSFDYLKGRVLKIDLSGDELDTRLYDRDNGPGAAAEAIAPLKGTAA